VQRRRKARGLKEPAAPLPLAGLDPSVVTAARAAGVSEAALGEMHALISRTHTGRQKPEPAADVLGESEEELLPSEEYGAQPGSAPQVPAPSHGPREAELFATALVKAVESMCKPAGSSSPLERALDGAGGGSGEGLSLPSARRNSAARRALRDALVTSPHEISAVIEALMAEDLASVSPGVAVPGQTSARAWAEHRSRVSAYPSSVCFGDATPKWAVWLMAGALDCLRTDRPAQARARLNLGLMIFDQMSIDHGSFVMAGELALEVPPPIQSFRQHEGHATGQVYSRLLDPRWAEVAIGHLKEQAEFPEKRAKLGRQNQPQPPSDTQPDAEEAAPKGLLNSLPRLLLKSAGPFASCLRSSLADGFPWPCAIEAKAGTPLNRHQKRCVKRLEAAMFGTSFPFHFSAADLGRHAAKVEAQNDILAALGRAADSICRASGYFGPPSALGVSTEAESQVFPQKRTIPPRAKLKVRQESRHEKPSPGEWSASFPLLCRSPPGPSYVAPLSFARDPQEAPPPPAVKVLGRKEEKLKLYRALAQSGRLLPATFPEGPANGLESPVSCWTKSLASAVAVTTLVLEPDRTMVFSGADLRECFYQFVVGEERLRRNMIADRLDAEQAAFVFGRSMADQLDHTGHLCIGFASLAMGDSGACEYTQCAHLGVVARGGALLPGELLVHGSPPPRGLLSIGLIIDDLICLDRVVTSQLAGVLEGTVPSVGHDRLQAALAAYREAPLEVSDKKVFSNQVQATVEIGLATQHLLESLAGCWISIFILKRRLLSAMSLIFDACAVGSAGTLVRLSPELRAELGTLALLGPSCAVNLRAQVDPTVTATDASSSHQAAARAPLPQAVADEAYRQSVQKGAWTRLLAPPSAWLKSHGMLETSGELPGEEEYKALPLYCALAACPRYRELWCKGYKNWVHINVAELEAFLREERRAGARSPSSRFLFGLDSQPTTLPAAVKSASLAQLLGPLALVAVVTLSRATEPPELLPPPLRLNQVEALGCPWVLVLDAGCLFNRCPDFDENAEKVLCLLSRGAFLAVGAAPVISTFSKACVPRVRSSTAVQGSEHLAPSMHQKDLTYWFDCPDSSWWWRMAGWEAEAKPSSAGTWRVDMCRFGSRWRKRTRIATNTSLQGARPWTSVAGDKPRGFHCALATAVASRCGWCQDRPLDAAACAKLPNCCRVGEAANPGPRPPRARPAGLDLERAWTSFLLWCSTVLSFDPTVSFVSCPALLAMVLRAYGNYLFQSGLSLQTYRYTILAAQRLSWGMRGQLGAAWELVSRWERLQPVRHRTPVPEAVVQAMIVLAWAKGYRRWAGATLLAFYGLARIGEVLKCRREHLLLPRDHMSELRVVFLKLDAAKSSSRGGAKVQHLRVDLDLAVLLLEKIYAPFCHHDWIYPFGPATYRARWDFLLGAFGKATLTPGGLRGGGAVWAYHRGSSVSDIQWRMRLQHQQTLAFYLQEVAALNIILDAGPDARTTLFAAAQLFSSLSASS
ncbi:DNAJ1, partial [Symbiodinium sp. CCMP2592]